MDEMCLDKTVVTGKVKSMPLTVVACELFYSFSCSVFSVLNYVIFFLLERYHQQEAHKCQL